MNKKIITIILIIPFLLLFVSGVVKASQAESSKLKAAYLLNFARFVYWPDEVIRLSKTFNICIIGDETSNSHLNKLSDKKIKNKDVNIKYISKLDKDLECRIIYISKNSSIDYVEVIKKISKDMVLTVSDITGFSTQYGMIEFVNVENRIKFKINVTRSAESKIKYRSQLLEVAVSLK